MSGFRAFAIWSVCVLTVESAGGGKQEHHWRGPTKGPLDGPWMSPEVRTLLEGIFLSLGGNSSVIALEYGSGGSTKHFSRFAKEYYSIESDPAFFRDVQGAIQLLPNVKHTLRPENVEHLAGDAGLIRRHPMYPAMQSVAPYAISKTDNWASYLQQAARFGPKHFDFVLIDGMARGQAAFFMLDLVDSRSRVLIHDFWVPGAWPGAKVNLNTSWAFCKLLEYYRVEGAYSSMMPYVSGGSVIVLQKLRHGGRGERGLLDSTMRVGAGCTPTATLY